MKAHLVKDDPDGVMATDKNKLILFILHLNGQRCYTLLILTDGSADHGNIKGGYQFFNNNPQINIGYFMPLFMQGQYRTFSFSRLIYHFQNV